MVVVSYVFIGVGPRTVGRQHPYGVMLLAAGPVRVLGRVLGPLSRLLILVGNAITPGLVLSSKARRDVTPEALEIFEKHTLTPYLGEPEHIGWLALFLASAEAAFITGAIIPADGGLLAHQTYSADLGAVMQAGA